MEGLIQTKCINKGALPCKDGKAKKVLDAHRSRLLVLDPKVFEKAYTICEASKRLTVDQKICMLLEYFRTADQTWPTQSYKDPTTGVPLGKFLNSIKTGKTGLTASQRARLLEVSPKVFEKTR